MAIATLILGTASLFALGALQGVPTLWHELDDHRRLSFHGRPFLPNHGACDAFLWCAPRLSPSLSVARQLRPRLTLEDVLLSSGLMMTGSIVALAAITIWWLSHGFVALPSILPLTIAATLGAVGLQTALGGFLLAIIADNNARLTPNGAQM